jgi:hypothetical protein
MDAFLPCAAAAIRAMKTLLSKNRLNLITRTLYGRGAKTVFYKVTPTIGETIIATITGGFTFVREQRAGQEIDGSGVKFWISASVIDRATLSNAAAAEITANGVTTRYAISDLLPQQQLGAGYVLRLKPQKGATG